MRKRDRLVRYSNSLRRHQTPAEHRLWQRLKCRQLGALKFRRQFIIATYIVDFVCLEKNLVVELDGGQHNLQQAYDQKRTRVLNQHGFRVLRFWNHEVMTNLDGVLAGIQLAACDNSTD